MLEPTGLRPLARQYARPLILFGLTTLAVAAVSLTPQPWAAWQPSACFPNCFCEAIRPGFVRQPANTFSNLAYILVGLLIAFPAGAGAPHPAPNIIQSHRGYVYLYGWSVVAIGAGSLFYHASLTLTGQFFDWVGMYAFISFVTVYTLFRLIARPLPGRLFGGAYALLLSALSLNFFVNPHQRTVLFQNLILTNIVLEVLILIVRRPRVKIGHYLAGLACLVAARLIWGWDLNGTLCAPESLLQGHAVWHILTALTTAFMYRYYCSEQARPA